MSASKWDIACVSRVYGLVEKKITSEKQVPKKNEILKNDSLFGRFFLSTLLYLKMKLLQFLRVLWTKFLNFFFGAEKKIFKNFSPKFQHNMLHCLCWVTVCAIILLLRMTTYQYKFLEYKKKIESLTCIDVSFI